MNSHNKIITQVANNIGVLELFCASRRQNILRLESRRLLSKDSLSLPKIKVL